MLISLKVSNFDQTATKERDDFTCKAAGAAAPVPPDARLKEPKSKATCVRDPECVTARGSFLVETPPVDAR